MTASGRKRSQAYVGDRQGDPKRTVVSGRSTGQKRSFAVAAHARRARLVQALVMRLITASIIIGWKLQVILKSPANKSRCCFNLDPSFVGILIVYLPP